MEIFTIKRTGQRPVTFMGHIIASTDSQYSKGRDSNRWYELTLYRTKSERYVLHIGFRTQWQGELDHDEAIVLASPEEIAMELRAYDPCSHMDIGPDYPQFQAKQAKRALDLKQRYNVAVSELLAGMPEMI